jgi:aarF domain-containing kinase
VYKATLQQAFGGGEVAVKVQRPQVLESVALDLFLVRRMAELLQNLPQVWR